MDTSGLSARARRLVDGQLIPEYITVTHDRGADTYDRDTNPNGYIPLSVAENKLMWDVLSARMAQCRNVPARVTGYDHMIGSGAFRDQVAELMGERIVGRPVTAEEVITIAGAGSVLDQLFFALCDPGEGVLVPTPSYAGFWMDIEGRAEVTIVPVHCSSDDGFQLTIEALDAAVDTSPVPVKALLFTTPNNPLGTVYSAEEIDAVVRWGRSRDIHLVFDEIYALSVFGDSEFVSVGGRHRGDDIHIVWAFSKDFSVSGLRCGVLVTDNEAIRASVGALAYWHAVSGDTQYLLGEMISDRNWVDEYLTTMRARLRDNYEVATGLLDRHGIAYVPAEAGFFFIVDLRPFLDEPTWGAEERLWRQILDANTNLTPGAECRIEEPGFFRLCFAAVDGDALRVGIERMVAVLEGEAAARVT